MDALATLLDTVVLGHVTVEDLCLALLAVGLGLVLGRIAGSALDRMIARLAEFSLRRATLAATSRPLVWALRLGGIWLALRSLPFAEGSTLLNHAYQGTTIALATWLGVRLIGDLSAIWARRASGTADTFDDQLVPIVRKTAKVILVCVGGVMVLQNLGYSVGSLLAGLGIGTAAIAFASKDTIANFFGSLVVFIDRPFQVGDWVEIGDVEGTVEEVDIRTTRIRTFANSLITVPNSHMTTSAIQNWSRMQKRRIKLDVGVTYDTTPAQMRAAVEAIRTIIKEDERLLQDFYLVNFNELGESSLNIFCYLFTRTTNWAEYMQIRQEFLLKIMEAFAALDVEMAFPTRTLHFAGEAQPPGAPAAMLRQAPR